MQDVNWRGRVLKGGVKLWSVGTDTAKDLLHGRLKVAQAGSGYVHFSRELPSSFFAGLTIEQRVLQKTATGHVYRWVNPGHGRNEPLDCTVYALFAAHALDLHRYTSAMWMRLESIIQPAVGDLFASPLEPELGTKPWHHAAMLTAQDTAIEEAADDSADSDNATDLLQAARAKQAWDAMMRARKGGQQRGR